MIWLSPTSNLIWLNLKADTLIPVADVDIVLHVAALPVETSGLILNFFDSRIDSVTVANWSLSGWPINFVKYLFSHCLVELSSLPRYHRSDYNLFRNMSQHIYWKQFGVYVLREFANSFSYICQIRVLWCVEWQVGTERLFKTPYSALQRLLDLRIACLSSGDYKLLCFEIWTWISMGTTNFSRWGYG